MPERPWSGPIAALLLLAAGASVSGCYSKVAARDGKFTFAYPSMVDHVNFVKPIAPGAKLEVNAFANGTHDELAIVEAKSSSPDVISVAAVKQKSFVLLGKSAGTAEIEVRAKTENGTELVDRMFFHVAKPVKHSLEHGCTEDPEAAYVVGDEVVVYHSMATDDKRSVVGFDYAPLAIEPRSALELVDQPQAGGYYLFKAKSAKARVTLRSKIDEQTLTVKLVQRKDLTEASLIHANRMLVGQERSVVARVTAGNTALCSQNALTKAKSLTPDICKVTAKLEEDPDGDDSNREQLARVRALAFGVCKFEITLPELANGKGVTLKGETKIGREEYPGDQGARTDERVRQYLGEWSQPLRAAASLKDIGALVVLGIVLGARRRRFRFPFE